MENNEPTVKSAGESRGKGKEMAVQGSKIALLVSIALGILYPQVTGHDPGSLFQDHAQDCAEGHAALEARIERIEKHLGLSSDPAEISVERLIEEMQRRGLIFKGDGERAEATKTIDISSVRFEPRGGADSIWVTKGELFVGLGGDTSVPVRELTPLTPIGHLSINVEEDGILGASIFDP